MAYLKCPCHKALSSTSPEPPLSREWTTNINHVNILKPFFLWVSDLEGISNSECESIFFNYILGPMYGCFQATVSMYRIEWRVRDTVNSTIHTGLCMSCESPSCKSIRATCSSKRAYRGIKFFTFTVNVGHTTFMIRRQIVGVQNEVTLLRPPYFFLTLPAASDILWLLS